MIKKDDFLGGYPMLNLAYAPRNRAWNLFFLCTHHVALRKREAGIAYFKEKLTELLSKAYENELISLVHRLSVKKNDDKLIIFLHI